MRIFIVFGSCGEHDDAREWTICAYSSEEKAVARVAELEFLKITLGAVSPPVSRHNEVVKAMRAHPSGDPEFQLSYSETEYRYYTTELIDKE